MKVENIWNNYVSALDVSSYIKNLLIMRFKKVKDKYSIYQEVRDYVSYLYLFNMIEQKDFDMLLNTLSLQFEHYEDKYSL